MYLLEVRNKQHGKSEYMTIAAGMLMYCLLMPKFSVCTRKLLLSAIALRILSTWRHKYFRLVRFFQSPKLQKTERRRISNVYNLIWRFGHVVATLASTSVEILTA